jgi:hypothetical protein
VIEVEHQGIKYELTQDQVDDIKRHYEIATSEDSESGFVTGNHWLLMAVIQRCGIPVRSTVDAMEIGRFLWNNY